MAWQPLHTARTVNLAWGHHNDLLCYYQICCWDMEIHVTLPWKQGVDGWYEHWTTLAHDKVWECLFHAIIMVRFVFTLRFLKGSLSVNSVRTENLQDAWDYAGDHDSGLTFSTLEEQLTKRVSTSTAFLMTVLLESHFRLITYLHIWYWAVLYSGWVFWMISWDSKCITWCNYVIITSLG